MEDEDKGMEQLLQELSGARRRIAELEQAAARQKETEQLLQESEDKFRNLVERSNVSVYLIQDGVFRYVNPCFAAILGYTIEEMTDRITPEDIVYPEDYRAFSAENIRKRLSGEIESIRYEVRLVTKTGDIKVVEAHGSRAEYNGRPAVIGTILDVTEHKKADKELSEAEERYRTVFENTGAATVIIENDTTISIANAEFERLSGYTREEIEGRRRWTEFVVEEDLERMLAQHQLRRRNRDLALQRYEFRFVTRSGEVRYVYLIIDVIPGTDKSVASLIDITDRRQIEEDLQKSEELLNSIVENIPDMIFVKDAEDLRFVRFNKAGEDLLGYSRKELIGKTDHDFFPEDQAHFFTAKDREVLRGGHPLDIPEETIQTGSGKKMLHTKKIPVLDSLGSPRYLLGISEDITGRKRTEEDLQAAHQQLLDIIEFLPDATFVIDLEKRVIAWNKAIEEMTGVGKEEILGKDDYEYALPFYGKRRPVLIDLVFEQDEVLMAGYDFVKKVGDRLLATVHVPMTYGGKGAYLSATASPLFDGEGRLIGAIESIRDLTEQRRMETELRDSEERYRTAIENSNDGVAIMRGDLHLYVNRRFVEIFGYDSPDEIVGKPNSLLISPDDADLVGDMNRRRQEGRPVPKRYEFKGLKKDGHPVYIEVSATQIVYQREAASLVYLRDVTERRRADDALKESEETLRALVNATQETLLLIDRSGTVLVANEVVARRLGTTVRQMVGSHLYDHFSPDLARTRRELNEKAFVTGELVHFTDTNKGNVYDTFVYPVFSGDGLVSRVAIFAHDITQRTWAEEERIRLESQLRQSQKMEAIGTLAGGVAHDFNNLLTTIIGYASLLQMNLDNSDPNRVYIDPILESSHKASILTQSLLAFSRKQVIELKPRKLNEIVQGVEKLLRRLLTEDIEFSVSLTSPDITVKADETQIDQVLMNLAANARDAMPKGGLLHIETRSVFLDEEFTKTHGFGKPGEYALISVTDNGTGMDRETKEKIFEPFFTTKEVGTGTGLGLSIVYGIIEQHGGHITVYSELQKGTRFTIYLPAVGEKVDQMVEVSRPAKGGTETILVAEDNQAVRKLVKEVLTEKGYTVIEATDGDDAIRRFMDHKDEIDLLLLDVVMPKRNGKDTYEEIEKIKPHIKVLFTSGYTGDVVLTKGIHDEALNFISKPLSPNELVRKTREVLDK